MRRFAAKHADVALSANLASKDIARIAAATMPDAKIKARTAIKNPVDYQHTGQPTNPLFLSNKNNELQGLKSGSSIPLNLLGGHRWPNADAIDRDLLRKIVKAEIGDAS